LQVGDLLLRYRVMTRIGFWRVAGLPKALLKRIEPEDVRSFVEAARKRGLDPEEALRCVKALYDEGLEDIEAPWLSPKVALLLLSRLPTTPKTPGVTKRADLKEKPRPQKRFDPLLLSLALSSVSEKDLREALDRAGLSYNEEEVTEAMEMARRLKCS